MTLDRAHPGVFDRVVIDDAEGHRELSVERFLELPLSFRIRAVLERTARFFSGTREVDRHAALDALRQARLSRAS